MKSFVDPLNCQKYYFCNGDEMFVHSRNCPNGFHFNIRTLTCTLRILTPRACQTIACQNGSSSAFQMNPQYYYRCLVSSNATYVYSPKVFRCDTGETWKNEICSYRCRSTGTFPHENPNLYYECYLERFSFKYRIRSCGSKRFNVKLRRCDF